MGRVGYTLLAWLAVPLALLHLLRRALRQRDYLKHIPERFGFLPPAPDQPVIWVHAVSVGETRAAQPLIAGLLASHPGHCILLTHMTPTGRAVGEALYGDRVDRCYLPYDLPFAVRRFLSRFRPAVAIFMETELWPNYINECRRRGIRTYLVNARLSEKSFRGYRRVPGLSRPMLQQVTLIIAQGRDDARRFRELGAPRVRVAGNVKFDIVPPAEQLALGERLRERFGRDRPVLLAASTREGEEAALLTALAGLDVPRLLIVIVPRHPQRFDEVAILVRRRGFQVERRSREAPVSHETRVVLGDSMGEMFAYYAACDVAFIGGSLLPHGGQNLIEACAVGKPVIIGPSVFNFEQAVREAVAAGAAVQVQDAAGVAREAQRLLIDTARIYEMGEAARRFAEKHRGATARTLEMIRVDRVREG